MRANQETKDKWNEDSKNWKLAIFYFNSEDKRILVPKKNKFLVWTLNFANVFSYLILVALFLVLFLVKFFS